MIFFRYILWIQDYQKSENSLTCRFPVFEQASLVQLYPCHQEVRCTGCKCLDEPHLNDAIERGSYILSQSWELGWELRFLVLGPKMYL